jgi:predicted nucleic acid-binding protein
MYYIDTSAFTKIYHAEEGSEALHQLYAGNKTLQISELTRLEFLSAATRKRREELISQQTHEKLLTRFEEDIRSRYELLRFTSAVVEEAAHSLALLPETKPLRTLDALQLAFYKQYCQPNTIFVCADVRLLDVVSSLGRSVLNLAAI